MSRIEIVVLVSICGILTSLLLPALSSSRGRARRLQCQHNLRYVTLATQSRAINSRKLPALVDLSDGVEYGWPVRLLAYLDRADLYKTPSLAIPAFTCPSDPLTFRQPGGLSFVANAGYGDFVWDIATKKILDVQAANGLTHDGTNINWDRSADGMISEEDLDIARSTGVFWRRGNDGFSMSLDRISNHDGLTQTLMYTESLHAGNDRQSGWSSAVTSEIAFVLPSGVKDDMPTFFGESGEGPLKVESPDFSHRQMAAFAVQKIENRTLRGHRPAPSSLHADGVNVAFCDGHGGTLSFRIDRRIFARLMSSGGERFGQTLLFESEYEPFDSR